MHYGTDRAAAEQTLALMHGDGHHLVGGDLSDPAVAERVVAESAAAIGTIDVLVNNAAVAPAPESAHPIDRTDYATWQRVWSWIVDVDLLAVANVTHLVANRLIDAEASGVIVNVGSRGAVRGEPEFPAYGAAKAGLHAFGQSMAVALAPFGIAVSTVSPGFIGTERQQEKLAGAGGDAVRAQSPFGRVGTPDEVAAAIVYLTSADAQWASGAVLDLNGASHLR